MRRIVVLAVLALSCLIGCGQSGEDFFGSDMKPGIITSGAGYACEGAQIDVVKSLEIAQVGEGSSSVVLTEGGGNTILSIDSLGYSIVGVIAHSASGDLPLELPANAGDSVQADLGSNVEYVTICLGVYAT